MNTSNPYRSPAQLVADACSENQVALLIPCHRVIRSDGSIGGYRWGAGRKRELLKLEAAAASCSLLSPALRRASQAGRD